MSCSISASLAMHVAVAPWWMVSCLSEEDCSSVTQSIMAVETRGGSSRSAACGPSIDCTIDSASIFLIRR